MKVSDPAVRAGTSSVRWLRTDRAKVGRCRLFIRSEGTLSAEEPASANDGNGCMPTLDTPDKGDGRARSGHGKVGWVRRRVGVDALASLKPVGTIGKAEGEDQIRWRPTWRRDGVETSEDAGGGKEETFGELGRRARRGGAGDPDGPYGERSTGMSEDSKVDLLCMPYALRV